MQNQKDITIICLEGVCSAGKSTLCDALRKLQSDRIVVLDEHFLDQSASVKGLHLQSVVMESMWINNLVKRLFDYKSLLNETHGATSTATTTIGQLDLSEASGLPDSLKQLLSEIHDEAAIDSDLPIIVTDRSLYSAIVYAHDQGNWNGYCLVPYVDTVVDELTKRHGIHIKPVLVTADKATLWNRIQKRLVKYPERQQYMESDEKWFDRTLALYEQMANEKNWLRVVNADRNVY
jgi:thymidylate kinase